MVRLISTISLVLSSCLLFTACTTVPEQLKGEYTSLVPKEVGDQHLQTPVRWGGVILETRPGEGHTCFEILSRQLEKSMRPRNADQSLGRFVACKSGFYDPEVFKKNRAVTLTGKIVFIDVRKVGDFDYRFPVVEIEFLSLWPHGYRRYYVYGPYRPYYWHYPHYGWYYRYPYW